MPLGPGNYDELCTYVREQAEAEGAIVIVLNGNQGQGFACQLDARSPAALRMPELLEDVARQMRESFGNA